MSDLLGRLRTGLASRYAVDRELGRGGMAHVYLARDLKHNRQVAIKVLRPELSSALGPERFLREIEIAAGLHHPHVLPLYDSGKAGDLLYYVMPYAEGESLRDRLQRERQLPVDQALQITREVGLALAYAHSRGVIHRDIKPENIMLESGQAVVTDFGIARAVAEAGGEHLTETGLSIGTPSYMSPEQATAEKALDGRSDLYSLACVLYEMLAGEPPHAAATPQALLARRLTEAPPSARTLRDAVSEPVDGALRRALARVPADRYSAVTGFLEALAVPTDGAWRSAAVKAGPSSRRPGRRASLAALALGAVLVTGALGYLLLRGRGGPGAAAAPATPVLVVLPFENLGNPGDEYFADGMTEEVTARLAGLQGLRVIGRTSAVQYKHTTKTIPQIGQELGADYLLEGTVRWEKPASGPSRVRVTPQLVRVSDQSHVWAGTFDAVLADVFQVQSTIATQVTEKLNVTLLEPERAALADRPTENLGAYEYYLRGGSYALRSMAREDARQAVEMYRQATALDPGFPGAWAALARSYLWLTWLHREPGLVPLARSALDSAERLAPDRPETWMALGYFYYYGVREYRKALEQFEKVRAAKPNDPEALASIGFIHRRLGNWAEALRYLEQSAALDPRNHRTVYTLGETYVLLRRFDEAERALSQAIAIAPDIPNYYRTRAFARVLAEGDTAAAGRIVADAATHPGSAAVIVGTPNISGASLVRLMGGAFPGEMRAMSPATLAGDTASYYLARLELLWLEGDPAKLRAVGDSARAYFQARIRSPTRYVHAEQVPLEVSLAVATAALGRRDEALRLARVAMDRVPLPEDGISGPLIRLAALGVLVRSGQTDEALGVLEELLQVPAPLTAALLRVDPLYAPLRGTPRFERMLRTPGASSP